MVGWGCNLDFSTTEEPIVKNTVWDGIKVFFLPVLDSTCIYLPILPSICQYTLRVPVLYEYIWEIIIPALVWVLNLNWNISLLHLHCGKCWGKGRSGKGVDFLIFCTVEILCSHKLSKAFCRHGVYAEDYSYKSILFDVHGMAFYEMQREQFVAEMFLINPFSVKRSIDDAGTSVGSDLHAAADQMRTYARVDVFCTSADACTEMNKVVHYNGMLGICVCHSKPVVMCMIGGVWVWDNGL